MADDIFIQEAAVAPQHSTGLTRALIASVAALVAIKVEGFVHNVICSLLSLF